MRVALDATPLLGRPTGVGRYVAGLVSGLTQLPDPPQLTLAAFTARGSRAVPPIGGARVAGRPFPARALQALWSRSSLPPVEWLAGRCDVFHATNYVLPPTRRAAGVLSVHDLSFALHPDTVTPQVERYQRLVPAGIARAEIVLALTETAADEIAEFYATPRSKVRVARPGVDSSWASAQPPDSELRLRLGLPARYLLFVGTVEPRKNLPMLLRSLARASADRAADIPPLVLAGPAGWGVSLDLSALPANAVIQAGYLDDKDLQRVVAGATALLYPSRHEGFGLPPLEALATGTAVVSSDLPVLREVTAQHATYIQADDVDAWAAALIDAASAPPQGPERERVRSARRAYAATWTWQRCAEEAFAAYTLARDCS